MNIIEMARQDHKKKYLTAIHESSHAVMCLALGKHFDFIELTSADQGEVVGIDSNITDLARAKILLAGSVGENIYTGKNTSMQFQSVDDLQALKGVNTTFLKPEVERILRRNWAEIIQLSNRLMKRNRIYYSEIFETEND